MSARIFGPALAALSCAGCANLHELKQPFPPPHFEDLVEAVECELGATAAKLRSDGGYTWIDEWYALVSISAQMEVTNGGGFELAVSPDVKPSILAVGGVFGRSKKTTTIRKVDYFLNLKDLVVCSRPPKLIGTTGSGRWLADSADTLAKGQDTGNLYAPLIDSISVDASFVITQTAGISPIFSLVPVGSSTLGGSAGISGEWKDTHHVIVSVKPKKDAKPTAEATEVQVAKPRAARRRPPRPPVETLTPSEPSKGRAQVQPPQPPQTMAPMSQQRRLQTVIPDDVRRDLRDAQSRVLIQQIPPSR